jgi:hypothetical protein
VTCHPDHRVTTQALCCGDCVVQVDAWSPTDGDPRTGDLYLTVISNSSQRWHGMWRNRIKNAWAVLRNRYDWSGFNLATYDEACELAQYIEDGAALAFTKGTDE